MFSSHVFAGLTAHYSFGKTPRDTESHPLSSSAKAIARRCYGKAGFKLVSSSQAHWGAKKHLFSKWECWRKVQLWLETVVDGWLGVYN